MLLRRHRARRILNNCSNIWPINKAAAKKPDNWPGWPDGKKFAFVLTHDVESQIGLDRVQQLAEAEMELGFRSSFNFIPEGSYKTPLELLKWLNDNDFEVGVHDLNHDGRLYNSYKGFQKKSKQINHYLKEWRAVGFRSGFMLRQLDWLHNLNISYDASTFDTDPFEPQPDGVKTIFPFIISKKDNSYVELPYTLPQDSTLFLILQESNPEIWKTKLQWIVQNEGLGLVNVHPDYLNFSQKKSGSYQFTIRYYIELLQYVKSTFAGQYWHALPCKVAEYTVKAYAQN